MSDNKIVTVGGGKFLLWGFFLKLVIADRLGLFVDAIYGNPLRFSGLQCLAGSLGYTLQIYTDFAGYSYIAMGLAKLLGFNLINNFARPYFSVSVTDFWRRWHISLSRWLKDYIYIPLGGNRCSKARNYWNIFVTFLVSGVWHGANWTFVVWGLLHGLAQIVEKFFGIQKCDSSYRWVRGLRIVLTFCLVSFLWILFRSPSIGDAAFFVNRIFTAGGSADIIGIMSFTNFVSLALALPILVFKDVRDEWQVGKWRFCDLAVVRWIAYLVLVAMILNIGVFDGGQFIYVSF